MKKLNDILERVQVGRDKEVPLETNSGLWLFWNYNDYSWDADTVVNWRSILDKVVMMDVTNVFCIWHGQRRTNMFLMDKNNLIKRLKKMGNTSRL